MGRGVSLTHRAFHTAGEACNLTQLLRLLDFGRSALAVFLVCFHCFSHRPP